jgi:hypothetical protein
VRVNRLALARSLRLVGSNCLARLTRLMGLTLAGSLGQVGGDCLARMSGAIGSMLARGLVLVGDGCLARLTRVIGLALAGSLGLVGSGSLECLGREVRRWTLHDTSQCIQCGGIGFWRKGGTNVPFGLLAGQLHWKQLTEDAWAMRYLLAR